MNFIFSFIPFKKYIRAFFLAFVITVILGALLSIAFSFFPPSDKIFEIFCNVLPYFASFIAAFFSGYSGEKSGAITGLFASVIFMLILFFAGVIFFNSQFSFNILLKTLSLASLCGICGGIIGINCK